MRAKVKPRKKSLEERFKKITKLFPNYANFQKDLDETYKKSKNITSKSIQELSRGSGISLSKNIDDAKIKLLCASPKKIKNKWDALIKHQLDEINEKKAKKEIGKEEPAIYAEMKEGLLDLHDLIVDGTDSVANVKLAAVRKETKRVDEEKQYRQKLEKLLIESDDKTKEELKAISAGWEGLKNLQNPLEINRGTSFLREKCDDLLRSKDDMINYLKNELKEKDEKFVLELEKQGIEIDILIDRIEQQISVLKDAYSKQLEKLEEMIDGEKEEIIINNRKIWEALIKERDDIDRSSINKIYQLAEDHEMKIDMDNIEQNENQRALEIDLNKIIHNMTLELDHLRSMCTLNIEKISYNYQLLLKRHTENKIIKSENKRHILHLKSKIDALKNKIQKGTFALAKEISEHASAIDNLKVKIKELEERSIFLATANSKQYFDLWDFNQKRAEQLLQEIFMGDKALFEQVLYMPWVAPKEIKFPKETIPSYQEGLKVCAIAKKNRMLKAKHELKEGEKEDVDSLKLIRVIVKNLPSACSFFLDQHLKKQIQNYSLEDKLLLQLDGIFNALSINSSQEMMLLAKYFARYVTCPDCKNRHLTDYKVSRMVQTDDRLDSEGMLLKQQRSAPQAFVSKEVDEQKNGSDVHFLRDHIKHHLKVIAETVFAEVHNSYHGIETSHDPDKEEKSVCKQLDYTELTAADIVEKHKLFECKNRTLFKKDRNYNLKAMKMWIQRRATETSSIQLQSNLKDLDQPPTLKYLIEGMTSQEYLINWFVSNLKQSCFDNCNENIDKEPKYGIMIFRDSKEFVTVCRDLSHQPFINPINIAKAIKEFTTDYFGSSKIKNNKTLNELMSKMKVTLSRCLSEKDVEDYWKNFLGVISKEKVDLWDTMYFALQDYLKALQKRHDLNNEISKLKKSNFELRRLLQRYIEKSKLDEDYVEYFRDLQQELDLDNESHFV